MKINTGKVIVALIIIGFCLLIGRLIAGQVENMIMHEEQLTIVEAVKKTSGGDTRTVDYFIFTDKGYFKTGGPVDEYGVPFVWNASKTFEGQLVRARYCGAGLFNIDAWGNYRVMIEVHALNETHGGT